MNLNDWGALALLTLKDPAAAARQLMGMNLPRDVLWLVLGTVSVLNTLLLFGPAIMLNMHVLLPGVFAQPVPYAVLVTLGLVLMIVAVFLVGTRMGGQGRIEDVAVVLIWMQIMRLALQCISLVLQFVFPVFTVALAAIAAFYSIYILLHFVDQALRLGSLARSALVLIASVLALAFALTILLTLVGAPMGGMSPDV